MLTLKGDAGSLTPTVVFTTVQLTIRPSQVEFKVSLRVNTLVFLFYNRGRFVQYPTDEIDCNL